MPNIPKIPLVCGEVFQLVAFRKPQESVVVPPSMWVQMVQIAEEIKHTRYPFRASYRIDWCVIGDAVPNKSGASLYDGLPPYAAPTSNQGKLEL